MKDLEEESVKKWQRKWTQTTKGRTTKEYFPDVSERLKVKLQLTQNFNTHSKRAWENKRLPTSFQNNRRANVSMRRRGPDN